uniref:B30.2/SPRY domain-containing protein n=1 Tax=Sphenodon punctatus TaxID=8508 RepID=A0A8D0GBX6_SPHPU
RRFAAPIDEANLTLDRDTAHAQLIISDDRKSTARGYTWEELPDTPERFDAERCVLGCEGFTLGRHYWEVEVGDKAGWALGVARESVRRKGGFSFNPDGGIWSMARWAGQYLALDSPEVPLKLDIDPMRIRVSLDYEQGLVAFFCVDNATPIFTFPPASFNGERIRPFLFAVGPLSELRLHP